MLLKISAGGVCGAVSGRTERERVCVCVCIDRVWKCKSQFATAGSSKAKPATNVTRHRKLIRTEYPSTPGTPTCDKASHNLPDI